MTLSFRVVTSTSPIVGAGISSLPELSGLFMDAVLRHLPAGISSLPRLSGLFMDAVLRAARLE